MGGLGLRGRGGGLTNRVWVGVCQRRRVATGTGRCVYPLGEEEAWGSLQVCMRVVVLGDGCWVSDGFFFLFFFFFKAVI